MRCPSNTQQNFSKYFIFQNHSYSFLNQNAISSLHQVRTQDLKGWGNLCITRTLLQALLQARIPRTTLFSVLTPLPYT